MSESYTPDPSSLSLPSLAGYEGPTDTGPSPYAQGLMNVGSSDDPTDALKTGQEAYWLQMHPNASPEQLAVIDKINSTDPGYNANKAFQDGPNGWVDFLTHFLPLATPLLAGPLATVLGPAIGASTPLAQTLINAGSGALSGGAAGGITGALEGGLVGGGGSLLGAGAKSLLSGLGGGAATLPTDIASPGDLGFSPSDLAATAQPASEAITDALGGAYSSGAGGAFANEFGPVGNSSLTPSAQDFLNNGNFSAGGSSNPGGTNSNTSGAPDSGATVDEVTVTGKPINPQSLPGLDIATPASAALLNPGPFQQPPQIADNQNTSGAKKFIENLLKTFAPSAGAGGVVVSNTGGGGTTVPGGAGGPIPSPTGGGPTGGTPDKPVGTVIAAAIST